MKFKIFLLSSVILSSLVNYTSADIEKKITIYMENGTEKELTISVPASLTGRADEYVKAYTMLYMKWWNAGVGFNLPYTFDIGRFKNSTPPKRITALAGDTADYMFDTDLITKIGLEASTYVSDLKYKGDDNASEKEIEIGSPRIGPYIKIKIQIPERFKSRHEEYSYGYQYAYIDRWNKMARSKEMDSFILTNVTFDIYITGYLKESVGGDIKNYLNSFFNSEYIKKEIEPLLDKHIEKESARYEVKKAKWAAEEKRMGLR